MSFSDQIKNAYQSRAARLLTGVVTITLFLVQMLIFALSVVSTFQSEQANRFDFEMSLIQETLDVTDGTGLQSLDSLIGKTLIGLALVSESNIIIFNKGDTLEMKAESVPPQSAGTTKVVVQQREAQSGLITVVAFINIWQELLSAIVNMVLFSMLAVFVSAVAALTCLWAVFRCYIKPMSLLVDSLRSSGDQQSGVPSKIDFDQQSELSPIVYEFNCLIEKQRETHRQIRLKQQYLEFAAHHDPLTHLPNRLMFDNELKKTVHLALKNRLQFAVFLVDIDNFKFFNDQYGHLLGDKMVAEIGNRLRQMMREIDVVARLDGDEFVVIQKEIKSRSSTEKVAARIMQTATAPFQHRGFTLKAAVSVGISCFPHDVHLKQKPEMLGEEIVNNAAVALQESKGNGKNQYQRFDERMRHNLTARIRLEQDLKLALQEGQFELHYQPKINIHNRQCIGSEALVRWRHPVNGFVSPEAFIPVAEENGLILELGEWILETACEETRELQLQGFDGLNVAVNISAVQFADGGLLGLVRRALESTQLSPNCLELEITESAVMHDPEEVIQTLHELSQFGMHLAIDDFGTGYSSLAYLKRFPVDTLKIDRAFITDISNDTDDVAIVEAVLGLGQHFNMKVVAEGVEDAEQLKFLKAKGCAIAQGYFISKPLSAERYRQWLERWPYGVQASAANSILDLPVSVKSTGTG